MIKTNYLKRNYGITEDEFIALKQSQDFKCAICGSEGFLIGNNGHVEKLVVDHCHSTGKVRELLCQNCNRGLGLFQDSPEFLKRAAAYIEKHAEGATTIRKE